MHNTSSKKYANNACKAHIRRILFYAKGREWQALLSNVIICLSSVIVVFSVFRKFISSCCGSIDSERLQWNTQCSCFTSCMPSWRGIRVRVKIENCHRRFSMLLIIINRHIFNVRIPIAHLNSLKLHNRLLVLSQG